MRTVPLGLASVAAAVQGGGRSVEMVDLMGTADMEGSIATALQAFAPDLVGISIRNLDNQSMGNTRFLLEEDNRVVQLVRKLSKAPVVLGGAGYSICPAGMLEYTGADMGIQGEGELAFRLLVERLESAASLAGLPGLYLRGKGACDGRTFVEDLDEFPLPGTALLSPYLTGKEVVPVQTRRGCAMGCSYCSTALIEGRQTRKRSPGRVVEWMARLREKGSREFYFVDNTFNLPRPYALDLCRRLARASLDLAWRCILYPWKVDEAVAAAMAEAGCVEASVGFESGCEPIMATMHKRFRRKDVAAACALLRKHAIRRSGFLLLGAPGETRRSIEESLRFADSLDLDLLKITTGIRIYPHTRLAGQARKERMIATGEGLLFPRFYMAPGVDPEWVRETVEAFAENRPNWIVD